MRVAYDGTMPKRVKLVDGVERRPHFIQKWREWRGLSQDDVMNRLADRMEGFSKTSLSRVENGKQPYSQDWLEGLAWVFHCTPAEMLMMPPDDPRADLLKMLPKLSGGRLERAEAYIHGLLDDTIPDPPQPERQRPTGGVRRALPAEGSHPQRSRVARRKIPADESE